MSRRWEREREDSNDRSGIIMPCCLYVQDSGMLRGRSNLKVWKTPFPPLIWGLGRKAWGRRQKWKASLPRTGRVGLKQYKTILFAASKTYVFLTQRKNAPKLYGKIPFYSLTRKSGGQKPPPVLSWDTFPQILSHLADTKKAQLLIVL